LTKLVLSVTGSAAEDGKPSFKRRKVVVDGPDPIDRHVGGLLRLRRAQVGLTQSELADKVGLSFQGLQKYETGENRISASRLYQFAQILDVPPAYFFEGLGDAGESDWDATSAELSRKEAALVLGAYYGIKDPRMRAACLMIMSQLSGQTAGESE
jgi:transcriptional regulator with XRE-family HTH domain